MRFSYLWDGALVVAVLSAEGCSSAAPTDIHGSSVTSPQARSFRSQQAPASTLPAEPTANHDVVSLDFEYPNASREAIARLLPSTEHPDCYGFIASMGTGRCTPANNNKECGFDGGDCCECTCTESGAHACGSHGYDCQDPDAACELAAGSQGLSSARRTVVIGVLGAVCAAGVAAVFVVSL